MFETGYFLPGGMIRDVLQDSRRMGAAEWRQNDMSRSSPGIDRIVEVLYNYILFTSSFCQGYLKKGVWISGYRENPPSGG